MNVSKTKLRNYKRIIAFLLHHVTIPNEILSIFVKNYNILSFSRLSKSKQTFKNKILSSCA
jgi:hypothetical protein